MKRLALLMFALAMGTSGAGCTLAGGFIGSEVAYSGQEHEQARHRNGTSQTSSATGFVAGAAIGLVIDVALVSLATSAAKNSSGCFVGCGGY